MAGSDRRQALYLIADQMRGIATAGRQHAANVYEAERAERQMGLAADLAAMADDATPESVRPTSWPSRGTASPPRSGSTRPSSTPTIASSWFG